MLIKFVNFLLESRLSRVFRTCVTLLSVLEGWFPLKEFPGGEIPLGGVVGHLEINENR